MNTELKPSFDEQQCYYCKHWFPAPVCLHHDESECLNNQKETQ